MGEEIGLAGGGQGEGEMIGNRGGRIRWDAEEILCNCVVLITYLHCFLFTQFPAK